MNPLEWYDGFQKEISELEQNSKCPVCGSSYVFNTNPFGYDFMCGCCCYTFKVQGKYEKEISIAFAEH